MSLLSLLINVINLCYRFRKHWYTCNGNSTRTFVPSDKFLPFLPVYHPPLLTIRCWSASYDSKLTSQLQTEM